MTIPAHDSTSPALRRALRLSVLPVLVAPWLLAGPALAAPTGWDEPDPVSLMQVLLVFVAGPLGLFLVTVLLASAGSLAGRARSGPQVSDPQPEAAALEAPERTGLDELLGRREEPAALEPAEADPAD